MRALFDDAVARQHQDAVGMADGRQAMGDDQRGSPVRQAQQRLLHRPFALIVERAGRLVEDQNLRILEEGAGDGDALALAARKLDAALADIGIIALGQSDDEVVRIGGPGRRFQFGIAGVGPAVAQVVRYGAGKKLDILLHHPDMAPERGQCHIADIGTVDADRPGLDIIEARYECAQCALADP